MSDSLQATSGFSWPTLTVSRAPLSPTQRLVEVAQELSTARQLQSVMAIVRRAARELTGADGATFVLRDGDFCFYADENAISPLWKGQRFPLSHCISGWVMLNREPAVIEDIYVDSRIPQSAYRPTFVKSLAMVPIRTGAPVGAIGNYWAERHRATEQEVMMLRALADLTSVAMENVQLYEELQRKIIEAEEAVRVREEFIMVAAHELKTPLTAMLLRLQRLEKRLRNACTDEEQLPLLECAAASVTSAQRFAALVERLLDASRLANERIRLRFAEFDLAEATRGVVHRLSKTAKNAGSDLRIDASGPLYGRWDRDRLEQVLAHLLSNALKYGAGKPIVIALERRGDSAHLEVSDQGAGIDPKVGAKLFERFGRAGPISHYGGLGLGLYLAREVIEMHGGSIRYDSKPNDGCTFIVDLPLRPDAAHTGADVAH